MSICAPEPFGSKFLKGGYSYWPLWWYGQKSKLHDMSGHGVDLTPNGAYFDGQGYYFDGSDYLADADGRKIISELTVGTWSSVYLTEGAVPPEGSIRGVGTQVFMNDSGASPKITGKIVLRPEHCPNLTTFQCKNNNISVLDVSKITSLEYLYCYINNISVLDVSALTKLIRFSCRNNNISVLDVSKMTSLNFLWIFNNNISLLDVSAITGLSNLRCENNSMDQDMVDTVLCDLASHTTENGTLNISGNAEPSQDGKDCRDILVARGWSVTTD